MEADRSRGYIKWRQTGARVTTIGADEEHGQQRKKADKSRGNINRQEQPDQRLRQT
jgi:hypothetical protein